MTKFLDLVWVLKDLSNGPDPGYYIWWFLDKGEARKKYKEHLNSPSLSNLSPPEEWSCARLHNEYRYAITTEPNYYIRREEPLRP